MPALKKLSAANSARLHSTLGKIVDITANGTALVDFQENIGEPIAARSTLSASERASISELPAAVMLMFEDSDPAMPVITAVVNEGGFSVASDAAHFGSEKIPTDVSVDGKKITFDAKDEINLRCGKSSILLRRDGKVVIKGSNLVSRSTGGNKIKGSSVNIN